MAAGGSRRARLLESGTLKAPSRSQPNRAESGERALYDLIKRESPAVLAVDAPLTLPPCLTCTSNHCQIPSREGCKGAAAKRMWRAGGHPLTERHCELFINDQEDITARPLPTMRIGQIAARGLVLQRVLARSHPEIEVIEVYPRASIEALGIDPGTDGESSLDAIERIGSSLRSHVSGQHPNDVGNRHELDAVVAAYTGWLYKHRHSEMRQPTEPYVEADGWIWVPA